MPFFAMQLGSMGTEVNAPTAKRRLITVDVNAQETARCSKRLRRTGENVQHGDVTMKVAMKNPTTRCNKGDLVSVPPTVFDGNIPGSFSTGHPGRCFGVVVSDTSQKTVEVCFVGDGKQFWLLKSACRIEEKAA